MIASDMLGRVLHRIYGDFLMPSRVELYADLLKCAQDHGYETQSVYSFWQTVKGADALDSDRRYLILRHDVDTDSATAEKMWEIEIRNGCISSFFFRLSTLQPALMKEMHLAGFDASYHYEEVSTVAKQKGLSSWAQVKVAMPQIRALFRANLTQLRRITGLPMRCVASHGDFVNRQLQVTNTVILKDTSFRKEVDIEVEAYDAVIGDRINSRVSDCPYPKFWTAIDPLVAIRQDQPPVLHVLTHPRHWRTSGYINAVDDVLRSWEGLSYRIKSAYRSQVASAGYFPKAGGNGRD
jgi:hypothetical protein